MNFKNKGFTLLELIISITILAILSTIAYIFIQDYNKETRNVVRLTDIQTIEKALEFHFIKTGKYPDPDNVFTVSDLDNGVLLWKQGIFGSGVITKLNSMYTVPTDPIFYKKYTYSVNFDNTKMQLGTINEN